MKRNTKFALGLVAATALAGALSAPAMAHGSDDGDGHGRGMMQRGDDGDGHGRGMMQRGDEGYGGGRGGREGHGMGSNQGMMQMMQMMMQRMQAMQGGQGGGMMGGGMGGMMGGGGMMGEMKAKLDANGDGTVTADEARAGLTAMLEKYDADGNGTLSLDEFETLHSAMIRERMVDRFQALDNDGDGQVTGAEMTAPADRIAKMQAMRAQQGKTPGGMGGTGMGGKTPSGMMGGDPTKTEDN